jgi:hypothetical protein
LAELGLHGELLAKIPSGRIPSDLRPAVGVALLATGNPEGALAILSTSIREPSHKPGWLRAASAMAQIDPGATATLLRGREGESPVALLLAHLRSRQGSADGASTLAAVVRRSARLAAEAEVIEANAATLSADRNAYEAALTRLFARFGLRPPDVACDPLTSVAPLVSVILAARDAARTIATSLSSLLAQSWTKLEIIVVDDASRDDTGAIARRFSASDPRIRILELSQNIGAYAARNRALAMAKGAFVTVHDADDIAHPERIASQVTPLTRSPRLVATTARLLRRLPDGMFYDRQIVPLIRLHMGSALTRTSFVRDVLRGYEEVRYGADEDFQLRLRAAAGTAAVQDLALPLTLAGVLAGSAVYHADTGYGDRGFSITRQAYREAAIRRILSDLTQETGEPFAIRPSGPAQR